MREWEEGAVWLESWAIECHANASPPQSVLYPIACRKVYGEQAAVMVVRYPVGSPGDSPSHSNKAQVT